MREKRIFRLSREQRTEEERRFTINNIIDICENRKWKKIGITTSSKNYRGVEKVVHLLNKASDEKKTELDFCELKPITCFAEALAAAKECDSVILSEKYGYTYYSEFDKCTKLLEDNNIPIAGVTIVK